MGDEAEFILSKFADDIKLGGVAVALGVWASWRIGERERERILVKYSKWKMQSAACGEE